jgi:hypothetical protein
VDEDNEEADARPLCPGCGKQISWDVLVCPHCGEEFEADYDRQRWRVMGSRIRRDWEPDRGKMILFLGQTSMVIGGLSFCMFGVGALVCVPLGIVVWIMATRDLARMKKGDMDPRGLRQTDDGRIGAVVGIILGLLFGGFFLAMYFARW